MIYKKKMSSFTKQTSAVCIQKMWRSYKKALGISASYQLYFDQEARDEEERFEAAWQEELDWLKRMEREPIDFDEWEQCDEDDYKNEKLHECK